MELRQRLSRWARPVAYFGTNPISVVGAVLTTSAGIMLVAFWAFDLFGGRPIHPYAGIVLFLILPGLFVLGLVLMPIGLWWRRRSIRRRGEVPAEYPPVHLSRPALRNAAMFVAVATILNLAIVGTGTYRGIEYMDSQQFCGMTCHKVMAPEFSAYLATPHSHVACVECHIGPGATWFLRAKLTGTRQLIAVTRDTYSRPIPVPVHQLRPAQETCEHCHWPRRFVGDKLVIKTKYSDDEANTPLVTVLLMKVGGHGAGGPTGIHGRHVDEAGRVSFVSNEGRRLVIPAVRYLDDAGKMVDFLSEDAGGKPPAEGERRTMDCMDCHNRPAHTFELPDRAVDDALTAGAISRALPFVRKKSVELLKTEYPDRDTAQRELGERLAEYYRKEYPKIYESRRSEIDAAGAQIQAIYERNVFPNMKVTWGTYPNHLGHEAFPGCFRCHDDKHKAADGRVIKQDCDACHTVVAMEESNPKILADLGMR